MKPPAVLRQTPWTHGAPRHSSTSVQPGPVVTRFEMRPAPGVKVSQISGLSKDLARALSAISAPVVEFHTGKYVELVFAGDKAGADEELKRLREAAAHGHAKGIEIHVGHGLTYDTVRPVAAIPEVRELNIGHFIMGEALFVGLEAAVKRMRQEIDVARGNLSEART